MSPLEIDKYAIQELRRFNMQPSGPIIKLDPYMRWFTTVNRPNAKFATILVALSNNINMKEMLYSVVSKHEELIR